MNRNIHRLTPRYSFGRFFVRDFHSFWPGYRACCSYYKGIHHNVIWSSNKDTLIWAWKGSTRPTRNRSVWIFKNNDKKAYQLAKVLTSPKQGQTLPTQCRTETGIIQSIFTLPCPKFKYSTLRFPWTISINRYLSDNRRLKITPFGVLSSD